MDGLYLAAKYGKIELIKLLLSSGVDINLKTYLGETACMMIQKEVIPLLIRKGADVCIEDDDGNTAFHYLYPQNYRAHEASYFHPMIRQIV